MKKTFLPFKKKLKHLKKLIQSLSANSSEKVIREIKRLFAQLSFEVPSIYIKRTLIGSSLAIALLSGYNVSAQEYKAPVKNPFGITDNDNVFVPTFFDKDGDGDYDLMTTSYYGDHLIFTNTGTKYAPNFSAPVTNPNGLSSSGLIFTLSTAGDIDNDGDVDIIETGIDYYSYGVINFNFIENTGTSTAPAYSSVVQNPFGLIADSSTIIQPKLIDVDNDGDLDILTSHYGSGSSYYGVFKLYRNVGTASSPNFSAPVINPFNLVSSAQFGTMTFGDIDRDGDEDFFYGDYYGHFTLYKDTSGSTGDPGFTSVGLIDPNNLVAPDETFRIGVFVDIDSDNDLDFFANTITDSTSNMGGLWFFKDTLSHVGIKPVDESALSFSIYPQPVINDMNVEILAADDKKTKVTITDAQGRVVFNTELYSDKNNLNLQSLQKGIYTIQLENDEYKGVKKFVKQ